MICQCGTDMCLLATIHDDSGDKGLHSDIYWCSYCGRKWGEFSGFSVPNMLAAPPKERVLHPREWCTCDIWRFNHSVYLGASNGTLMKHCFACGRLLVKTTTKEP